MNRPFMFAFGAALAGAAALHGQTTDTASARSALPVLVSDLTIRSTDSPLVRAAKTTVAARVGQASRSTGVIINDAYLKTHPGGKISEARETAPPPPAPKPQMRPETDVPVITPKPKGTDPLEIAKKQEVLRQEQARLASEIEDPYGGDSMDSEQAERRMAEIAKQLQQNEQKKTNQTPENRNPDRRRHPASDPQSDLHRAVSSIRSSSRP